MADTSAVVALVDHDDRWHEPVRALFETDPGAWVIPWATLPEIDYLLATHVGRNAQDAFLADLAEGAFAVEWGRPEDARRAHVVHTKHRALRLGLVDSVVIAVAERLRAKAIATLDLRHFGAVALRGRPKLLPRDA
ncbi:MAG TPA: PIN domain-containing protein [Polyangiaceae bacterium]|nr:PIN domain-containing protein [Polyangiaceae bacterium]